MLRILSLAKGFDPFGCVDITQSANQMWVGGAYTCQSLNSMNENNKSLCCCLGCTKLGRDLKKIMARWKFGADAVLDFTRI